MTIQLRRAFFAAICTVTTLAATETLRVASPSGEVVILRDSNGVPHIRAKTEAGAIFGLGYMHALDRLWQMEYQRRIANGQVAEILGSTALPVDMLFRTIGMHRAAAATWKGYSPSDREPIAAYVAGVNAYLATNPPLPVEFQRLGLQPAKWRPEDVIAWSKVLAWAFASNWDHELLRLQIAQKLGPERADQLMPAYTDDGPTIIDGGPAMAVKHRREPRIAVLADAAGLLAIHQAIVHRFGIGGEGTGSNSWVLSGSRTTTGKPIVAGDPHVDLQSPSLSYLAHLTGGRLNVTGGTGPGRPDFLAGHNGLISWTITTANSDIQDLYAEHINDRNEAEFRGTWEPLQVVPETIHVKGAADVNLKVRISRHGPLISDVVNPSGPPLALRWTELDPAEDGGLRGFLGVARATNWREFVNALRSTALHQNVIYGDSAGNIGYQLSSTIPFRSKGDGTVPVPGWTGEYEWTGYVPFERLPRLFNPRQGYIVTANNKVIGDSYPYRIGNNFAAPFRAQRIIEMISARDRHTPQNIEAMQADVLAVHARELLPLMLRTTPLDDRSRTAIELLRNWDLRMTAGAPAAVFEAWYTALARRLFADELGEELWRTYADNIYLIGMAVRGALLENHQWCDIASTRIPETCADTLALALQYGLSDMTFAQQTDRIEDWDWTKAHTARFPHAVFGDLSRAVPNIGDRFTVNVGSTFRWETYDQLHGAIYRQIVDLSDLPASRFVIAPGQSGDPSNPHYDDLLPLWQRVDYIPVRMP
jgi:penicillin amidase